MNKSDKNIQENQQIKKIDSLSLENTIVKKSLDTNYDLDLVEGTNAYYSERYGWTLKRES